MQLVQQAHPDHKVLPVLADQQVSPAYLVLQVQLVPQALRVRPARLELQDQLVRQVRRGLPVRPEPQAHLEPTDRRVRTEQQV